jgi:hypothetical protein
VLEWECHGWSSGVTLGNKLLPHGISEGYAKAKLSDSKIKAAVLNFLQIQHNIVDFFTNIIRFESENVCIYIGILSRHAIKNRPPGGFLLRVLRFLNARKPP